MTTSDTAKLTYPKRFHSRELACGLFVVSIATVLCWLLPVGSVMWICAAAVTVACLCYGAGIALRASSAWQLTDDALIQQADSTPASWFSAFWTRRICWTELTELRLRYFSTRRDHSNGWFELKLSDGQRSITVEDSLEGFETILAAAQRAADRNQLTLNDATKANLSRIGEVYQAASRGGLRAMRHVPE